MNKILALTEDEKPFEALKKMVSGSIEIKTMSDPLIFLEVFLSLHCQIVVLDIDVLKDKTGSMINILHLMNKDIPLIIILSKEKMPVCLSVFSKGISTYLIKPVSPENLKALIESTIKSTQEQIK